MRRNDGTLVWFQNFLKERNRCLSRKLSQMLQIITDVASGGVKMFARQNDVEGIIGERPNVM